MSGIDIVDESLMLAAAEKIKSLGVANIIITMGAEGAFVSTMSEIAMVPAPSVRAIDTTGAGDSFNGAVAVALVE